mgnify:CR=1 FL=1
MVVSAQPHIKDYSCITSYTKSKYMSRIQRSAVQDSYGREEQERSPKSEEVEVTMFGVLSR